MEYSSTIDQSLKVQETRGQYTDVDPLRDSHTFNYPKISRKICQNSFSYICFTLKMIIKYIHILFKQKMINCFKESFLLIIA